MLFSWALFYWPRIRYMLTLQSKLLPYVFSWSLGVYLRHLVAYFYLDVCFIV